MNTKDFYLEIFHLKKLPIFYNKLTNTYNNDVLLAPKNNGPLKNISEVYLVSDVPSYMEVDDAPFKNSKLKRFSVKQHNGLLLDFKTYNDFDGYFKDRFGSSNRQLLRRGMKALDTSFNSTQKMYFGDIQREEYDKIFETFYTLLSKRFEEKEINNGNLNKWDYFTNLVYPKILNKTASLFVIYDNDIPIAISLNFHLKDIIFPHIVTYDVDYSKFRIGHTLWIYFIKWCFENNIGILDLSKGNYDYLRKLANKNYQMDYHIFFNPKKVTDSIKALILLYKLRIKQFVRDKNIHMFARNVIDKLPKKSRENGYFNYTLNGVSSPLNETELIKIDLITDTNFSFLKRIIYDILFKTSDTMKDINVFKATTTNTFYYKSKKVTYEILIDKN